jgi:hypothetical protein
MGVNVMETVGLRRLALGVGIVALTDALSETWQSIARISVIRSETTGSFSRVMPRHREPE